LSEARASAIDAFGLFAIVSHGALTVEIETAE
jgi:hypothetical protein